MALTKVRTGGITADAVDNTILDLTDNFSFTGTVTGLVGGLSYNGGTTLQNLRIQTGTATLPSSSNDTGSSPAWGVGARYYSDVAVDLTGFASTPSIFAYSGTNYHDTVVCSSTNVSASQATFRAHSGRSAGLHNATIYYLAIGQAS